MFGVLKRKWELENGPGTDDLDQTGVRRVPKKSAGSSGVTNWTALDKLAVEHWRTINTGLDNFPLWVKEQYAVHDEAGWPFREVKGVWRQPSIVIGSRSYEPGQMNLVKIVDEVNGFYGIETLPYLPQGYSEYSPSTHPWLYYQLYSTDRKNRTHFTKAGQVLQFYLDPVGRGTAKGDISHMLWLEKSLIKMLLSELPPYVPPPPPPDYPKVITIKPTPIRKRPNLLAKQVSRLAEGVVIETLQEQDGWGESWGGWFQIKNTIPYND